MKEQIRIGFTNPRRANLSIALALLAAALQGGQSEMQPKACTGNRAERRRNQKGKRK